MSIINPIDVANLRASGAFDEEWYLNAYPDVVELGIDPAEHYLWIGAHLGRSPMPPVVHTDPVAYVRSVVDLAQPTGPRHVDGEQLDALFIDGTGGTSSTPYRVFRIANGLADEGWVTRCIKGEDLSGMMDAQINARFVIFHRAPYWSPFTEFVQKMRSQGSIIIYDIDDLVFDETVIPYIDGYRYLSPEEKEGFHVGVRAYRDFILNADICTSTTSFLVEQIRKLGKPAYKVRNAISSSNIHFFENIGYQRNIRPKPFVVAYYSGTKTHQADFAEAAAALIQFMKDNSDVVFRIVGQFDLEDWPELVYWSGYHEVNHPPRVTRVGLMWHDAMVRDQLSCDLIIAPLPVGNPFCEAKSELKFFEAALAKCPVIASATTSFVEATENGRFGHLAVTSDDWLRAFQAVYDDYPAALDQARIAYDYVRDQYSQRFAANEALAAYEDFALRNCGSLPGRTPKSDSLAEIGVLLPDFTGPAGGHRKIFSLCRALEQRGKTVKLYFYTARSADLIREDLIRFFWHLDADIAISIEPFQAHDIAICTQWRTAYDFRNIPFSGKVFYFVQDFEPMFYPMGSEYLRAMVSYTLGHEIICYGKWVVAKLQHELGLRAKCIPFTLDHANYGPPAHEGERDIDVLLYSRPSQHRRCNEMIVEGLSYLKRCRPDIRIGLFGEDEYQDFGFDFTSYGSIADLSELASLYRRAKLGVCYSPTNPSQLGYEMVACGVNLIDVKVQFSELNFDGDSFVGYCQGTPESMSSACLALLDDPAERMARQQKGYRFTAGMPSDDSLGAAFIREACIV